MIRGIFSTALFFVLGVSAAHAQERAKVTLKADQFDSLYRLIKPSPGEHNWAQVPWMPSTNIWAARKKAAEEGKPIFLWYMAGEPLGTC